MNKPKPPKRALKFLRWFCREDYLDEIEGDLIELFELNISKSSTKAKQAFWSQVILHFRPDYIKSFKTNLIHQSMFQNNFKIAWRHIFKKKLYSFINITGLGVGMASCMLILLFVNYELSYDQYHTNIDGIYRVLHGYQPIKDKNIPLKPEEFQVWGNAPVADAMKKDFPEIKSTFRFTSPTNYLMQYGEKIFQEDNIVYADSNAFDMFSWRMLDGNPKTALNNPSSIVLTEKLAQKFFGNENPVGKTLIMDGDRTYQVTGLMENVPTNSHFSFDALVSMSTFKGYRPQIFEMWGYVDFYTYFTLNDNASIESLKSKAAGFAQRYTSDWENSIYHISFEPLQGAYLHSVAARQPGETGSLTNIYIFISVAVFILLIACINFVNLSTSLSIERAKEVGIRKVVGARKFSLVAQFLTEFVLLSLFALSLAVCLVIFCSPILQEISGKPIQYQDLLSWQYSPILLGMVIVIGMLAGTYPAFLLSQFQPSKVLKGVFKTSSSGVALRKGLVIFQFSLSISLMVGTAIVFSQLKYLENHELGFEEEQMVIVDFGWDGEVQRRRKAIQQTILNHPNVLSIAASRAVPGDFLPNAGTTIENPEGDMQGNSPFIYEIDDDFLQNYKMEMAAGRPFSKDFPLDTLNALIVNEKAAKKWGYDNPEEMIGKKFDQWGKQGTVIGVVKDFNFQSLKVNVEPLSLRYEPRSLRKFSIRVKPTNISETMADLEKIWLELVPHRPFLFKFLNQSFNEHYNSDTRFGQIFGVFAGIAIVIACLGLFGLTAYTTNQRTKEIGIRKVLGASVTSIVTMLSTGFLKLFAVSLIIAVPASWYVMTQWLSGFAYQTSMNLWVFVVAGGIALCIALLTISWQSLKAAFSKPVDSLRSE